ncbi:Cyclic pyranopterin monophosphate synthase accessory protein, partial [Haemophilus influenzae]
EKLA